MKGLFDESKAFGGKVVVLTGAASGMGLRAAQRLVKAGAKVVMCDLDEARLRQEVARLRGCGVDEFGESVVAVKEIANVPVTCCYYLHHVLFCDRLINVCDEENVRHGSHMLDDYRILIKKLQ